MIKKLLLAMVLLACFVITANGQQAQNHQQSVKSSVKIEVANKSYIDDQDTALNNKLQGVCQLVIKLYDRIMVLEDQVQELRFQLEDARAAANGQKDK